MSSESTRAPEGAPAREPPASAGRPRALPRTPHAGAARVARRRVAQPHHRQSQPQRGRHRRAHSRRGRRAAQPQARVTAALTRQEGPRRRTRRHASLLIAHAVNKTGRREILSIDVGEPTWRRSGPTSCAACQARRGRRPARHLRRARRAEGRDRQGARMRLAALHRALLTNYLGNARRDHHGLLGRRDRLSFNADSRAGARRAICGRGASPWGIRSVRRDGLGRPPSAPNDALEPVLPWCADLLFTDRKKSPGRVGLF
jgi:hypothetical protein